MELLWIMRHGRTVHNVVDIVNSDSSCQVTLDGAGRDQAAKAGALLADQPFDVCFTSPFTRAIDTAQIILDGRAVPIEIRPDLAEVRCGDVFEGGAVDDYVRWTWKEGVFVAPPGHGGDCFAETLMRYYDEYLAIAARPERTGLVVTHGSPVAFARRASGYVEGEQLLPFPAARLAEPYRFDVPDLTAGLRRAKSQMTKVAVRDELGRRWAARRGLADSASPA